MSKKLHVLFLCGWYPSRVLPTNGDFIERHARAVNLKHTISILHIISDKNTKKNIEFDIQVKDNFNTYIAYTRFTKNPILKFFLFWKAFFLLLKKIESFDIVHLNSLYPFGIFAVYLKWFQKKKYIISEHWTDYHFPLCKKISFFEKQVSKVITKNANCICPVTKNLENSMIAFGLKGNYNVVPNVVDTDVFNSVPKKESVFRIVHVSNMDNSQKNITGILNVVSKLKNYISNFEFVMIGENATSYRSTVKQLKIDKKNIQLINHIPHAELVNYFHNSNLFILFSNFENLPCVILESFSTGTPVISSNVGGISEFFPENFGQLIEKNNENALLNSILDFYNKKNEIASTDEMHSYVIANFSKHTIQEQFSELYYKTLSKN